MKFNGITRLPGTCPGSCLNSIISMFTLDKRMRWAPSPCNTWSPQMYSSVTTGRFPALSRGDLQESKMCSLRGANLLDVNLKDQLEFPEFTPRVCPWSHWVKDCEKQCGWTQNKTRLTWFQVSLWTSGFLELVTSHCFETLGRGRGRGDG